MKLYTSYYYQLRNFPPNLIALNTTIFPPRYVNIGSKDNRGVWLLDCPPLKPGKECEGLCDGKCPIKHPENCKFLETYYNQLFKIDMDSFLNNLRRLHDKICEGEQLEDVDFAFIVFESPKNLCSERQAIFKWFNYYSIKIEEWQLNN